MTTNHKLVVFSDDWGRHPSSCQHLVSHLLDRFDVTWVNTIGMRGPAANIATIRRGMEKMAHWGVRKEIASGPRERSPRVLNPIMWPSFASRLSRCLNRSLLSRYLLRHVTGLESSIVITTIPVVADLISCFPDSRWVYYCVDDFSKWPGLDAPTMRDMEQILIGEVDEIVAAGDNLAGRIENLGRRPAVITHGVDVDYWKTTVAKSGNLPELLGVNAPIVMFWGLIDRRLNVEWLHALGTAMDSGSIVLVGPELDPDPTLSKVPRIHFTGALEYQRLPRVAARADVLVMPYANLPVTRAMQPLKLKEYLATGKPVVVSRLPATTDWNDCLFVADTAEQFVDGVIHSFRHGVPKCQCLARHRLSEEGWAVKAKSLEEVLLSVSRREGSN